MYLPPRKFAVDTRHPMDCTLDLRNPLYILGGPNNFIDEANFTYHKGAYPGIIKDRLYKDEEEILYTPPIPPDTPESGCVESIASDLCNATNNQFFGVGDPENNVSNLRYRAYFPRSSYVDPQNGHDYENVPLPCVAIFHPGGFSECTDYLQPGIKTICRQFASRGFIAITCGYRTGRLKDTDASRTSVQQAIAFNHRGKSLFRNTLNERICTGCDDVPVSDNCDVTQEDPQCP